MSGIEIYPIPNSPRLRIEPSKKSRDWMVPHAYRCLPITTANAFGWDLILTEEVSFYWNGGPEVDDVKVIDGGLVAEPHFGSGSITFPVGYTWKTDPGVHLMVGPPVNADKYFFHTVSAIIETDVLKYPWFVTIKAARKGDTILAPGTVLARVFPVHLGDLDTAIVEKPEPEEYRLARIAHAEKRNSAVEAKKGACTRFYRDEANHRSLRAPEVKSLGSEDILVRNDILAKNSFLTKGEAAEVAAYIEKAPTRPQSLEHWKDRTYDFDSNAFSPELYEKLTDGVLKIVSDFYGKKMKMEHPHLARWDAGHVMRPHSDYSQGIFPDRDYAVLIYLTDDYTGGEIFMPGLGIELAPDAGDLVAFPGGKIFHGVREVKSGVRITCITWLKDLGEKEE